MPSFLQDWFQKYRDQGVKASAGRYSYGPPQIQFRPSETSQTELRVGSFCSVGKGCVFNLGSFGRHTIDFVSSYPLQMIYFNLRNVDRSIHETSSASINIGSDVWMGEDSLVFSGVRIGHGAVVGARSLVTAEVPAYAIVAGSPARILRYRFDSRSIERLLALAWWDWPDDRIRAALPFFHMRDIEAALRGLEEAQATASHCRWRDQDLS